MILHKFSCIFIVLCLSVYLSLSHVLPEKCVTPEEKPGDCVLLEACPSLNNMSNDFETPMTMDRFHFLVNSQCTVKYGTLTVCCSLEELSDLQGENTLQDS